MSTFHHLSMPLPSSALATIATLHVRVNYAKTLEHRERIRGYRVSMSALSMITTPHTHTHTLPRRDTQTQQGAYCPGVKIAVAHKKWELLWKCALYLSFFIHYIIIYKPPACINISNILSTWIILTGDKVAPLHYKQPITFVFVAELANCWQIIFVCFIFPFVNALALFPSPVSDPFPPRSAAVKLISVMYLA